MYTSAGKLLSLNKSIRSSTTFRNDADKYGPQKAVDGNLEECAVAEYKLHVWYELDLGRNYLINRIELRSKGKRSSMSIAILTISWNKLAKDEMIKQKNVYTVSLTLYQTTSF